VGALVDELTTKGAIRSPRWAEAFASVPRHVFVPHWYEQQTNDKGITRWRLRDTGKDDDALAAVYRDQTLVTALDPATAGQVGDTTWTGVPTSSSTLPSLMAGMLEDLDVDDGHRVLEIGTGTGYNAALLCARLGEQSVYSIDIDPSLVRAARRRLAEIGVEPQLVAGDGQAGYLAGDRFDRIIATCSVPRIPAEWIEQTKSGGIIVTDVSLGIEGGLVRVSVDDEQQAVGHFTTTSGRFMPARTDARTYPARERAPYAAEAGTHPTAVTAADIRANYPFRLLLALELPEAELVYHSDDDGTMSLQLQRPDGSWARTSLAGPAAVTHGGDLGLWERVEDAWTWWNDNDRPAQDRFSYTRHPEGDTYVSHIPTGRRWTL
jgi:methyltransferase of ATP-grasp peptide maturase system